MKRILKILFPLILFVMFIGGVYQLVKPKIHELVLQQLQEIVRNNSAYELHFDQFSFNLLTPGLNVQGLRLWTEDSKQPVRKLEIEQITASLDFLQLLGGRFMVASLELQNIRAQADLMVLESNSKSSFELPKIQSRQIFSLLRKIPIARVFLLNTNLDLQIEKNQSIEVRELNLVVEQGKDRLRLDLFTNQIALLSERIPLRAGLALSLSATESNLILQKLEIRKDNSNALFSAQFPKWDLGSPSMTIQSNLKAEDFSGLMDSFLPNQVRQELQPRQPLNRAQVQEAKKDLIRGNLLLSAAADFKNLSLQNGSGLIQTQNLHLGKYVVGNIQSSAEFKSNSMRIPLLKLNHPSGDILLSETVIQFGQHLKQVSIQSQITTNKVDLRTLLNSIGVAVDLELIVTSKFHCKSETLPQFELKCEGQASTDEFKLNLDHQLFAHVEKMQAKGEVFVSTKDVRFKSDLLVGEGQGSTQGVVSFKDGFSIDFTTEKMLNLKALKKLANVKMEGRVALTGHTEGNSSSATFGLDFQAEDAFFENYSLGQVSGRLKYQAGDLAFNQVNGRIGSSSYASNFTINLPSSTVQAEATLNRFEASDIGKALARFLPFAIDVTGVGNAQISLSGPLIPNQLSYRAFANLERGTVYGESYDRLEFRVRSDVGRVQVERAVLRKGKSLITLQGQGFPTGELDFFVKGEKLALEDSENISQFGTNISGLLDFNLNINGTLRDPDFSARAGMMDVIIEDQEFPPSALAMRINSDHMEGRVSLFGKRLNSEFKIPFKENLPFRFYAEAQDWDYSALFSLIGGSSLISDYNTAISGVVDLSSENGGLKKANGLITIQQFLLARSQLSLANSGPLQISFKNGSFEPKNFLLIGPQATLQLSGHATVSESLALDLNAQLPLRLLQILFPFMEELSGDGTVNVKIGGPWSKPELLGTADINRGFVKFKNFPHPIERLESKLQFSKTMMTTTNLNAIFAGGPLKGEAQVEIRGHHDIPVNLEFRVDSVSMNFPEKIQTHGNLEMSLTGNWFPFTLAGDYNVQKGLVEKEFADDSSSQKGSGRSYIPRVLIEKGADPLLFDIQINLEQPIKVKNSMADATVTGEILVEGPPRQIGLTGEINFERNSKVLVKDRIFELTAGSVKLTNPNELKPELYFAGRTRVADYEINMLVQGTSQDPQIRLTSTPALPEKEIISLLALGMTSSTLEKSQQARETDNNTSYRLGSAILNNNSVTKKIQESLGLDLDISSSYDDKKNVATRRVTMSRRISRKVKASASRAQNEQSSTEVKLEYSLSPGFSAVGSWEGREATESKSITEDYKTESIFGLDLDYRKEFK